MPILSINVDCDVVMMMTQKTLKYMNWNYRSMRAVELGERSYVLGSLVGLEEEFCQWPV